MTSLEDRLDSFPEAWKPTTPGEKLVGTLVSVESRTTDFGEYPILTIRAKDGREFAWHAFHTVARSEVARERPQPGEQVGVAYRGPGEAKPGLSPPILWRVLVERPPAGRVEYAVEPETVEHATADPPAAGSSDIPF